MPIRLERFEMPKQVRKEEATATETYAKFIAEPFESGYGCTIANSLRRVLLSSVESCAITSIKIKGASHEFCALPGVLEDVMDIILNIKKILVKSYVREPIRLTLKKKGPGEVTAGDIDCGSYGEIVNPSHYIATISEDITLEIDFEAQAGRGFLPAEKHLEQINELGRIAIDSIFSPVTKVNFAIENTRVGQRTDYDRIVLDINTDGRVSPDDALTYASALLRHHLDVFVNYDEDIVEFEETEKQVDAEKDELRRKLRMSVNEIELSVRAANCLNNANITTVGELALKSEADMLKYRNFGKKSLNEIKHKLVELGLCLGMSFDDDLLREEGLDEIASKTFEDTQDFESFDAADDASETEAEEAEVEEAEVEEAVETKDEVEETKEEL
jgi:DNA-directed RNA polymerase subunit alpha